MIASMRSGFVVAAMLLASCAKPADPGKFQPVKSDVDGVRFSIELPSKVQEVKIETMRRWRFDEGRRKWTVTVDTRDSRFAIDSPPPAPAGIRMTRNERHKDGWRATSHFESAARLKSFARVRAGDGFIECVADYEGRSMSELTEAAKIAERICGSLAPE